MISREARDPSLPLGVFIVGDIIKVESTCQEYSVDNIVSDTINGLNV